MAIILAEMNIVSKKKIEEEETKERYRYYYIMVIVLKSLVHTATLKFVPYGTLRVSGGEGVSLRLWAPVCWPNSGHSSSLHSWLK